MRVDVSEVVVDYDLGGTTFTRRRPTSTLSAMGEKTDSYTDTTLAGIARPAATEDAVFLPEGVRLSDVQAFYTSASISVGDGAIASPDILLDDAGNSYRVLHVRPFGKHGYTRALVQKFVPGTLPHSVGP